MSRRDIRREKITENIEGMLSELVDRNAIFFEHGIVRLESDNHVTLTFSPELPIPTVYDIKVSRRR